MSTIEKAAARLVKKRVTESSAGKKVDESAGVTAAGSTPAASGNAFGSQLEPGSLQATSSPQVSVEEASRKDFADEVIYHNSCELDFPWLEENGFLVPNHSNHKQSQEFRRIKRPLLQNLQSHIADVQARPTNVVFVTSALPAEGKTFVSLNLALSLAGEVDHSVLLIDGDVAKGDLSRWMGIYDEPGLVDLLSEGSSAAEAAVIETNVERLSVLSCGKPRENLDELFASELMLRMIDDLANRFPDRIIVIDGPPLIPTTEAAVLAGLMGQTVVVVEANQTPQAAVEQAVGQLKDSQLVSMLLNKVPQTQFEGYGYGYGQGKSTHPSAAGGSSAEAG